MTCMFNVFKVREFKRRNGEIGQEVVVYTDDGYMCRIPCVDKSVKDFTGLKAGITEFEVETTFAFCKSVTELGTFPMNYVTLRIIG